MAGSLLLTPDPLDEAFFGFGGAMMNDVFNPFGGFEPNTLVGAGYQRFWGNPGGLQYGVEVGVAGRFGQRNSVEGWSGAAARYTFGLGPINVGLGFTFGLSAVTDTVVGQESESEAFHQRCDGPVLHGPRGQRRARRPRGIRGLRPAPPPVGRLGHAGQYGRRSGRRRRGPALPLLAAGATAMKRRQDVLSRRPAAVVSDQLPMQNEACWPETQKLALL
jgi:hypothetical protein